MATTGRTKAESLLKCTNIALKSITENSKEEEDSEMLPHSKFLELISHLTNAVPIIFGRGTCGTGVYCDFQDAQATLEQLFKEGSKDWSSIKDLNKIAIGDQKIIQAYVALKILSRGIELLHGFLRNLHKSGAEGTCDIGAAAMDAYKTVLAPSKSWFARKVASAALLAGLPVSESALLSALGCTAAQFQAEAAEFSQHMQPVATTLATIIKTTKARALETIYQYAAAGDFEAMMDGARVVPEAVQFSTLGGCTLLHHAAQHGSHEVVSFLLAAGADPGARDDKCQTPAQLAVDTLRPQKIIDLFKC